MLGRKVGEILAGQPLRPLFAPEVKAVAAEADLFVLNLECCISERGERWPDAYKSFFFRGPPRAVEVLVDLGVDCVTLANNHALDYGTVALEDTLDLLAGAGIGVVGAGRDLAEARRPAVLEHDGFRLRVVGFTDHPAEFEARLGRPGVAFADPRREMPEWLMDAAAADREDAVLVTPHWGPNMTSSPLARVRRTAESLVEAGASLVAGHSAHVFHGVAGRVLYDLGDFVDDYAVDPELRNDLGLLFLVDLGPGGPIRLEAVPLALDFCHTRLARPDEAVWITHRFRAACAEFGTFVEASGDRLVVEWPRP